MLKESAKPHKLIKINESPINQIGYYTSVISMISAIVKGKVNPNVIANLT